MRVDVQNAVIGLQQARARYNAAEKARELQQQTLDADQEKYGLGASTSYQVVQDQRDLASAVSTEVQALANYTPRADRFRSGHGNDARDESMFRSTRRWPGRFRGRRGFRRIFAGAVSGMRDAQNEPSPASARGNSRSVRVSFMSLLAPALQAQEPRSSRCARRSPSIVRPYLAPEVPPVRLDNSGRLGDLIRAGMLYLTAQDAIALALENNIDLEVARYNPLIAAWNLDASEAGGALPGVPSAAAQAGSVANGQGVAGSQAAAGVGGRRAAEAAATAETRPSRRSVPSRRRWIPPFRKPASSATPPRREPNATQSITSVLVDTTHVHTGLASGGIPDRRQRHPQL